MKIGQKIITVENSPIGVYKKGAEGVIVDVTAIGILVKFDKTDYRRCIGGTWSLPKHHAKVVK